MVVCNATAARIILCELNVRDITTLYADVTVIGKEESEGGGKCV